MKIECENGLKIRRKVLKGSENILDPMPNESEKVFLLGLSYDCVTYINAYNCKCMEKFHLSSTFLIKVTINFLYTFLKQVNGVKRQQSLSFANIYIDLYYLLLFTT